MTRTLVTGATGFVGGHLLPRLARDGIAVVSAGRRAPVGVVARHVAIGDIGPDTDWGKALEGCDTVIHLAARVPGRAVPPAAFDAVNDRGTETLVRQARAAGVARFVFLSSVFAGGPTLAGVIPETPYGRSKAAAEAHVAGFTGAGRLAVSMRPPLVYGHGAKGNWALLQRLAASPLPLPFGTVHNRRSVVAVENLADAILAVLHATPRGKASGAYAVSDSHPVGLSDMLRWLRQGMGRRSGLVAVPPGLLRAMLLPIGGKIAESLLGDLEVDSASFSTAFGWTPPLATEAAMREAGAAMMAGRG